MSVCFWALTGMVGVCVKFTTRSTGWCFERWWFYHCLLILGVLVILWKMRVCRARSHSWFAQIPQPVAHRVVSDPLFNKYRKNVKTHRLCFQLSFNMIRRGIFKKTIYSQEMTCQMKGNENGLSWLSIIKLTKTLVTVYCYHALTMPTAPALEHHCSWIESPVVWLTPSFSTVSSLYCGLPNP